MWNPESDGSGALQALHLFKARAAGLSDYHQGRTQDGRIASLITELDRLAEDIHPEVVACCQPSGINWTVPSIRLLEESLLNWSETRNIGFFSYTTQEIRAAIAGFANASPDRLGYAIMVRLGLIGQRRSTHEWEAVAVGYYHLSRSIGPSRSTDRI